MAQPAVQHHSPDAPAFGVGALFENGFRPFFLLASLSAATMLPLWLCVLGAVLHPATHFAPIYWHAHEMVFGFVAAVIAGFLLTAVANWTKRDTARGAPLAALCALWLFGRVAMSAGIFSATFTAIVDLTFLPALAITLARPILATNNRRNLVMIAVLIALSAANLMTHLDALGLAPGWQRRGVLVAADLIVVLMLVIAGRVVPMFTRNTTKSDASTIRSIPALDLITIATMAVLTAADAFATTTLRLSPIVVGALAAVVAVFTVARAARWGTSRTLRHPLLWILHLGYAWIAVGLLLRAMGDLLGDGSSVFPLMATHAITAGAIGAMTLGMMARVALGHTGRPIVAGRPMIVAFSMITVAALIRVLAPLAPDHYLSSLVVAGGLWAAAFIIYVVVHAHILVTRRVDQAH